MISAIAELEFRKSALRLGESSLVGVSPKKISDSILLSLLYKVSNRQSLTVTLSVDFLNPFCKAALLVYHFEA